MKPQYIALTITFLILFLTELLIQPSPARSIADLTQAIQRNPNDANAYFDRGRAYQRNGDYDRAIVDYTKAIKLKPDDAIAY